MMILTKKQRATVKRKFDENPDGSKTYREFRRRVAPGFDCAMIHYCNYWLGIETDGYAHS